MQEEKFHILDLYFTLEEDLYKMEKKKLVYTIFHIFDLLLLLAEFEAIKCSPSSDNLDNSAGWIFVIAFFYFPFLLSYAKTPLIVYIGLFININFQLWASVGIIAKAGHSSYIIFALFLITFGTPFKIMYTNNSYWPFQDLKDRGSPKIERRPVPIIIQEGEEEVRIEDIAEVLSGKEEK